MGRCQQPDRARDTIEVDAVVLVEAVVLDGDEGLLLAQGYLGDVDGVAAGLAEQRHQPPVAGVDVHRLLQLHVA